jgi:hypothetical protein
MNTTARIETTGKKNMIHISETTANILQAFGKGHWTKLREDKVNAKGKGEMTTYWLVKTDGPKSASSGISSSEGTGTSQDDDVNSVDARAVFQVGENHVADSNVADSNALTEKALRLVKWNADVIARILKDVMQRRQALNVSPHLEAVRRFEKDSSIGHVFDEFTAVARRCTGRNCAKCLSQGYHCPRARHSGVRCFAHDAALAYLPQMERSPL